MAVVNLNKRKLQPMPPPTTGHTFDPKSTYRFPAFNPTRRRNWLGRLVDWVFGR